MEALIFAHLLSLTSWYCDAYFEVNKLIGPRVTMKDDSQTWKTAVTDSFTSRDPVAIDYGTMPISGSVQVIMEMFYPKDASVTVTQ